MASIAVPDLYRQSILEEDLEEDQSRAQVEIQCRRQLSLSHTLAPNGLSGDYASSQLGHGVRCQAGRRDIDEQQEIQANSPHCNAFSMRGYVGSIRELDVNRCWPFPSHLMKRRLEESPDALLPPLKVSRYRYWECSECVENCLRSDSSCKNKIAKQQKDDSIHDKACAIGKEESLTKLPKNDHAFLGNVMQNPILVAMSFDTLQEEDAGLKAGQKMSIDMRSVESSSENDKEICHNGDDAVANSPVEPDDSINNSAPIKDEANSLTEVPKNTFLGPYLVPMSSDNLQEETFLDVEQSTPTDISSRESSFKNDKEVHNGDDVVQNSPAEHLTSPKISEDDRLYSINEAVACNATLWPTDSEANSNATQRFCTDNKDQVFANHTGSHMKAKSDMSDFTEKAEHLPHISCTVNSVALCNPVEKIFNENDHQISAEREKKKSMEETLRNNTLTSSIADGCSKEDCISEDHQVSAENDNEKSITETPGNDAFASYIADDDYKEDCIVQYHQVSAEKEKEKSIDKTPENNTLTSFIANDVYKEDRITQVSTKGEKDGILTKVKNHRAKRQKSKGKTLKKRLISDLIAVTPFEQLECNEVNGNCNVKNMSRKPIIGTPNKDIIRTWGASKAAAYRLRKFKENSKYSSGVREKLDLGSVEIKRKPQCMDVSYQSSASAKSVEEARSTVKRHFRSKKPQWSSEEMLSKDSRKQTPENGRERELLTDQDDDVLNDLASFMAKNQYERHARNSYNLEESECRRVSILQDKNSEAEDVSNVVMEKSQQLINPIQMHNNNSEKTLQMRDPIQLHENDCLKELYISTPYSSINRQVHLVVEDSPDTNQVQEPVMPEKLEMSGPAAEVAEVISHTRNAIILSADHHIDQHACKDSEKADRNLDKDINTELVNHKGSLVDASTMKAHIVNGFRPSQRKGTNIKKSIHHLKNLMKSSHDQLSLIEQTNAALNAALHNVRSRSVHVYNGGPDVSVPVGSCKDTQTVVGTSFNRVQTNSVPSIVQNQTVAQPVLAHTVFQMRPTTSNVLPNLANTESSNAKASQLPQTEGSSKGQREDAALAALYNPHERVQQPTMGEEDPSLSPVMRSTCKDCTFENAKGNARQANDSQVTQKPDMHMAQLAAADVSGPQSTSILTGIPVINFPVEHRLKHLSNSSISQPPSGEILSYFTLKGPSSLIAEQTTEAAMCRDQCQPLRSPVILSFSLGNKLDTETTLSQEFFDQGKFDLQSYIQKRIQSLYPSRASKSSTNEAVRGSKIKESQSANQNPVDVMDSENCVANKKQVRYGQNNAVLVTNGEQHHLKNVKVRQIQADNKTFPPISFPLLQTEALSRNLNTDLEIADGQNYKRKQGIEVSQAPTENQVNVPGENLHTTLERRVTNKKQVGYDQNNAVLLMNTDQHHIKNVKIMQFQEGSSTFPPISLPLLQTDALSQDLNTSLEITDGQNYKRKQATEASQAPTDNGVTFTGENLHTTLESRITNRKQVRYGQNNAVLLINTDQHHMKNVKARQVQEGSYTFPQISLPLLQTDALRRNLNSGLEIVDEQNCNRKSSTKGRQASTDNQRTILGENLNVTMENSVLNKKHATYNQNNIVLCMNADQCQIKNIKCEQIQADSNTLPPISLPLLQTDAFNQNLDTGLDIADGQNYKRKAGTEASQALAENQVTVLEENLHTTLENRVTNKKQVGYGQNNAVLLMNAYQHHIKNVKSKQVQAESNSFPPISPPLLQSDALGRNLVKADGQNFSRKGGTEASRAPTDNQATGLGENLNATNKNYIRNSQNNAIFMNAGQHHIKNIKVKQVQEDSNSSQPINPALLQTDALRGNLDTVLEVAHRQNCKRKRSAESRLAPTDNQATVPGKNLNSTLENRYKEIQSDALRRNLEKADGQNSNRRGDTEASRAPTDNQATGLGENLNASLGSKVTNKNYIRNSQNNAIFMNAGQHHIKNVKLKQVQADSNTFPPINLALLQTDALRGNLDTGLEVAHRQNCKRKRSAESRLAPTDNQAIVPGKNLNSTLESRDTEIHIGNKIIRCKLVQASSQTSEATTMTDAMGERDSMLQRSLRSGKLMESSNIVTNKPAYIPVGKCRKHVKKTNEAIAQKKLEAQIHCMQTKTSAAENCTTQGNILSSQAVASKGLEPVKHFAGSQHVLKPIAQNTQQLLPVPPVPFLPDHQDKVVREEILNTVQGSSQISKPITMTVAPGERDSMLQKALRSGKLMESSNIVNNKPAYIPVAKRSKFVKKTKEAIAQRKLEAQSHCMQTETCATKGCTIQGNVLNPSSQAVSSRRPKPVKHFAGSQHVQQRKLETESHCIQTGTCAAENCTTQGNVLNPSLQTVASEPVKHFAGSEPVKYFAGSQHVLKPIAQNTQQLLTVTPVPSQADQQDKVAMEERLITVQENSQTSKPIPMTDALGGGDSMLQRALISGNLMESSNIVNNMPAYIPVVKRRKYVKKTQKEAVAQRRLEAQWHYMQTETCAAENYTTQGNVLISSSHALASTGSEPVKHFASSQHVLKPITQNTHPFLVDQQDKVAVEERLNLPSSKLSSECSKRKSRAQMPLIPNIFDRAIEDYIKRGIVSVFPSSPQTLPPEVEEPMKLGAGLPLDSRPEHYGPLCNPPKLVQPNVNATQNHVFVDTSSTANIDVAPCAGNSNIAILECTNIMPCNMMPQQSSVTPEMQAYLEKSKLNFFSFSHADNTVAASNNFQSEPSMPTESGVSEDIQKQRSDGVALSNTLETMLPLAR